jgi:heterodisulfide reductase subunit A
MSERQSKTGLVMGGGVSGMTAAIDLAKLGHKVHLIEKGDSLGGLVAKHAVAAPGHEAPGPLIDSLKEQVDAEKGITVHLSTRLIALSGELHRFKATIEGEGGERKQLDVGVIIIATGARPFDPSRLPEFKYGRTPSIVTTMDFETMLGPKDRPLHPTTSNTLKRVGFVQCVGSRMETRGNPWCSHVCCVATLKQSLVLKERSPVTEVIVYYMDIRAFSRGHEELYNKAKLAGVRFFRGIPAEVLVRKDDTLVIRAEDASLGKVMEREMDLLVLSVGLEPSDGTAELLATMGIGPSQDGFVPVASPELRPCCTGVKGIMVAGTAEFPKFIKESILMAKAAALRADLFLSER